MPWQAKTWCIPPTAEAEFVAPMEDLRALAQAPYEARRPLPVRAGHPARQAYEYGRKGVCSLCLCVEPRRGWRKVSMRDRRPKVDWAVCVRLSLNEVYPEALGGRLGQDTLNTHTLASLYEAFLPEEARRLARRLESPQTLKHGRWLNMAETELSILHRQCRDRRLDDLAVVREEVGTGEAERNAVKATINWRCTIADARGILKNVDPSIEI